jgi:hypothetical protein
MTQVQIFERSRRALGLQFSLCSPTSNVERQWGFPLL